MADLVTRGMSMGRPDLMALWTGHGWGPRIAKPCVPMSIRDEDR